MSGPSGWSRGPRAPNRPSTPRPLRRRRHPRPMTPRAPSTQAPRRRRRWAGGVDPGGPNGRPAHRGRPVDAGRDTDGGTDASLEARARPAGRVQELPQTGGQAGTGAGRPGGGGAGDEVVAGTRRLRRRVAHAAEGVEPLWNSLWPTLEREGLGKLAPTGEAFDPNLHEAVAHEPGEGGRPTVAEVFRSGYRGRAGCCARRWSRSATDGVAGSGGPRSSRRGSRPRVGHPAWGRIPCRIGVGGA